MGLDAHHRVTTYSVMNPLSVLQKSQTGGHEKAERTGKRQGDPVRGADRRSAVSVVAGPQAR